MRLRLRAILVAFAVVVLAPAPGPAQESSSCGLHASDAASRTKDACLSCHGSEAGSHGHPVDLDYAAVRARRPGALRTADEVLQRGGRIPDGQLRCATCHDGASPWAHYIALPPGAPAISRSDPGAPGADDGTEQPVAAQPGEEVSTKPLCLACHRFD